MTTSPETDIGWYSEESATFGDRLCAAREAASLSQEDLGNRLGVKLKTIRAWEDDLAEPRANKLQMLAGILNVSLRWLLTGEGEGIPEPADGDIPSEMTSLLTELRDVRTQIARAADRVAVIEKRIRQVYRESAQ